MNEGIMSRSISSMHIMEHVLWAVRWGGVDRMTANCWNRGQMCHSEEVSQRSYCSDLFTLTSSRPFAYMSAFYLPSGYATLRLQFGVNQPPPDTLTDKSGLIFRLMWSGQNKELIRPHNWAFAGGGEGRDFSANNDITLKTCVCVCFSPLTGLLKR